MVAQGVHLASGSFVPCVIPQWWGRRIRAICHMFYASSSRGGLFGRPEIFGSGALLSFGTHLLPVNQQLGDSHKLAKSPNCELAARISERDDFFTLT
jgi:hypothetical protein